MEKILNQDEVDALLKGISDGEVETESQEQEADSSSERYDLTNQDRIIRGRMPTMEIINERFARESTNTLLRLIGKTVEVALDNFSQIKYGEFIKKLPVPASLSIFRAAPLRGSSLFFFDAKLVFLMVDILFGGPGRFRMKIEGRDFTVIEHRIVRRVLDMLFGDLAKAWGLLEKIEFSYLRSELTPQFANIVAPTDIVLASYFDVETEWERSVMGYCIPYATVEPLKDRLYGRFQSDYVEVDQNWRKIITEHLLKMPMDVTVEVGTSQISLRELFYLKEGDVLRLDGKPNDPMSLKIHGLEKGRCLAGQRNGSYAVELVSVGDKPGKEEQIGGLTTGSKNAGGAGSDPITGNVLS